MTEVSTPTNELGIVFVSDEEVPDAPRKNDRDDVLWAGAAELLKANPNQWGRIKVYSNASGAPSKASQINGGRNKKFPATQWEARYEKSIVSDSSVLFLRYVGSQNGSAPTE